MKNHICICHRCLLAIESREGTQHINKIINLDNMYDEPISCDLCGTDAEETLYEI